MLTTEQRVAYHNGDYRQFFSEEELVVKDPNNPEEGFEYLYVDASEEQALKDQIVYEKMPNGLLRLKAVVGKPDENIGVENLQGSGMIAGETSAAYDEVPTYCLVTGRTVPSFPYRRYIGFDSSPRLVQFTVEPNKPYDIRQLIDSRDSENTRGICDSNSFDEIMNEWAKTIIGILEPNAIVGIKFRGDKLLALQKRNDELMQQLDAKLVEEIKCHGADSLEANHVRNLITKRSDDLKKAYRGVTVELADLHDRSERMVSKKAVQHVVDLANSRNLFAQIFSLETAKVHICEMYLERADRHTTRQEAYKWLTARFEQFCPGATSLPPYEQERCLEKFAASETFKVQLNQVRAQSMERLVFSLSLHISTEIT
ncbi:carboxyl transferase domain protein [Teladorsagia circumcincta]|uniref:Carboxyl transferase domain protein n=1 Tax=Teladorsagia circumcincta TaxID=45464 RepID=A0A2G9TUJ3_TELCI|nr:carboxyl transferase domain protein [Teladorsagia circumcincta]